MLFFAPGVSAPAQQENQSTNATAYSIAGVGADYRIWQRAVAAFTNGQGQVLYRTNSYTELATGMNVLSNGQWTPASENIQVTPDGGAATNGQYQVVFAADVNASNAVEVATPDGLLLKTHVMGLSYYDVSTGSNVLFAELQDSTGQLVTDNQVVYSNAFTDCDADVLYTYTRAGFEQDIVVQQQLPAPQSFGLNPDTTWLQVWTEFIDPPTPAIEPILDGSDERLDFGIMKMERGKAFVLGSETDSIPVNKSWQTIAGRTFLIEQVQFDAVAVQSQNLPPYSGAGNGTGYQPVPGFPRHLPPGSTVARQPDRQLARANGHVPDKGLVLDYQIKNGNLTNITFQGDTTYLLTGTVNLYGTTTIEGGTVVKFANQSSNVSFNVFGTLNCATSPYQMAVFTALDDNTVGQTISNSTGVPSGYYAVSAIDTSTNLQYLRIAYATFGCYASGTNLIKHCQFINDQNAIVDTGGTLNLENTLFNNISGTTVEGYNATIYGVNLTVDQAGTFFQNGFSSTMHLTNSLLVSVTTTGSYTGTNNFTTGSSSVFTNVGAGAHYLATNTYRGVGTTNIDPSLLADLRNMTTYPPVAPPSFTNDNIPVITTSTNLVPQASRDTNTMLDAGYHYSPIDYMTTCDYSNCTVTLTNGVVLGYWRNLCISLDNGSQLVSQGNALQPNVITYYTLVQEQPVKLMGSDTNLSDYPIYSLPFATYHSSAGQDPSISMRFTSIYAPQVAQSIFDTFGVGGNAAVSNFIARDCECYGSGAQWYLYDVPGLIAWNNNLFQYTEVNASAGGIFNAFNNLYRGDSNDTFYTYAYGGSSVTIEDNAFDGTHVDLSGTFGWNAYLNLDTNMVTNAIFTNDIVTNLTWVTGPLGNFYQPTNSPLIARGTLLAGQLGLYHYTTQTNEVPEANGTVTIGYHYAALGANGLPPDDNSNGIPDYLEDVIVGNGPYILAQTQPTSQVAVYNGSSMLGVTAIVVDPVDYPLSYQWQFNGTNIPSAASSNYALATPASGTYTVLVTNAAGSAGASWEVTPLFPGNVYGWGADDSSQSDAPSVTNAIAIAAGGFHSLLVEDGGTVVAWGDNVNGQTNVPASLSNVVAVAAGEFHSLALTASGSVVAWGDNTYNETNVPPAVTCATAISAGGWHNLALLSNGTVMQWGLTNMAIPSGLTNVTAIASGTNFDLALLQNSTVVAWGANGQNQTNIPSGLSNVVAIAAGGSHALALQQNGLVTAWGSSTNVPAGLSNVMAIAAGDNHSLALKNDGTVVVWGDNSEGQTNVPGSLSNVKLIAAGGNHSLAGIFSTWIQYPVNVANDLLLVYNTNSTDSATVLNYYLQNRPGVSNANVLAINFTQSSNYETISPSDFTNVILNPVTNWLSSNPTKRPQYVILFLDMPTRVNDVPGPLGYYPLTGDHPSVSCQIANDVTDWHPFVTAINMGGTNDCLAYIARLASIGSGKLLIKPSVLGYGDANYFFDDTRYTNGFGTGPSFGFYAESGVLDVNPSASVTYKHDLVDSGGVGGTNHISFGTNVAGYLCWGDHSSLGPDYATNGPQWSGNSGWWIIQTIESFNGERYQTSQGNFVLWFSPNAFGGMNYSNAPIGGVCNVAEPGLGGNENSAVYFGLWEAGKDFAICAQNGANTPYFMNVGDPFISK